MTHFSLTSCYSRYGVFASKHCFYLFSVEKSLLQLWNFLCDAFAVHLQILQVQCLLPVLKRFSSSFGSCLSWVKKQESAGEHGQHEEKKHTENLKYWLLYDLFKTKMYGGKPRLMIENNGLDLEWLAVYKVYSEINGSHHEVRYHYEYS